MGWLATRISTKLPCWRGARSWCVGIFPGAGHETPPNGWPDLGKAGDGRSMHELYGLYYRRRGADPARDRTRERWNWRGYVTPGYITLGVRQMGVS